LDKVEQIRALLSGCTDQQKMEIFLLLRETVTIHDFETTINSKAEVILEALARASDLTIRGIRGIIGEATFVQEVVKKLDGWRDVTPPGNHSYDVAVDDGRGVVRVQVKLQRQIKFQPWIRNGFGVVEIQRTRGGKKNGKATRPYRFGEFDMIAVCMEPSRKVWNSFMYCPEKWLLPRQEDRKLIFINQPVSLEPDKVWTDDFSVAVKRLRSGRKRPG
jgi:hypothetical protein